MLYRIQGDILLLKCLTVHVWNFSVNYQLSDCYRVVYIWKVGKWKEIECGTEIKKEVEDIWRQSMEELRERLLFVCAWIFIGIKEMDWEMPLWVSPTMEVSFLIFLGYFLGFFFSWCCCFCCQQPLQVCCWVTPP